MKILFLSGAYKNAGDFLIQNRCIELLNFFLKNVDIDVVLRRELADKCEIVNLYDVVVIGGGPLYQQNMKNVLPVDDINKIAKSKIIIIGGGWYGSNSNIENVYNCKFDEQSIKFFDYIDSNGLGLGCRDLFTYKMLKSYGFKNVYVTGCPAWYDLKFIEKDDFARHIEKIKKIVISDPANINHYEMALKLVEFLKMRYKDAEIKFVFHRGTSADKYTSRETENKICLLVEKLKRLGIQVEDIAYCSSGFKIYDDCDLHVGFRVHAHIYNLSIRNRTVLLEEDGRGAGVNEILGMPSIRTYKKNFSLRVFRFIKKDENINNHAIEELAAYLDILEKTDWLYLKNAFKLQKKYFSSMEQFVGRIKL